MAVATEPGARAATASPMSPLASASATSVPAMAERSSEMPPSASGTPRIGSPISRLALSSASGAAHAASASAAAGRTTSSANSLTTSTSICSSSVGVRSKTPLDEAAATRTPGLPFLPALAKVRLALVMVLNPLRVTENTTCSVCLRSPILSMRSLWASLLSAGDGIPMGSRLALLGTPCLPPGLRLLIKDMPTNVTASYTQRYSWAPVVGKCRVRSVTTAPSRIAGHVSEGARRACARAVRPAPPRRHGPPDHPLGHAGDAPPPAAGDG